ncbi:carboxypeptidase-like regulatory domain-containing protein [Luteimonas sp. MJ246]|uniref:carboxypeptidase-like regulatory domain-containing protein n=1 Tax=Luteimonas sp. MJ174 TaxID=3129237 RepID=UPI0031BAE369
MSRHARRALCLALSAHLIGFPLATHAAEAPGALAIVVKDQNTDRPLANAKVTITERETDRVRSLETDAQGRILVEALDPGLYTVNIIRAGFAPVYEPSVRVATRKTSRVEFELGIPLMQGVVVQVLGANEGLRAVRVKVWHLLDARLKTPLLTRDALLERA